MAITQGGATPTRRTAVLVAGDAITLLIFAAIGRASHGEEAGLAALGAVVETAAPFIVGWFAAAPLLGVYRADSTADPRRMAVRTSLAWLVAWPIGLGLRALVRGTPIPASFAIVTFVTVLLLMAGWRVGYALWAARVSR